MPRALLAPQMLALHALVVLVLVAFAVLGLWQMGRFQERPAAAAVPATVTHGGTFDAGRQLFVAGRDRGFWLLTPLRLPDGSTMAVVRGWVASPADPAAAVPAGTVSVTGRQQPSEPTRPRSGLPAGQVATVSTAELVNLWRGVRLRDGYLVQSATPGGPRAVEVRAAPEGFNWRNLAYALQWWIFGAFAVFMWWKIVRERVA